MTDLSSRSALKRHLWSGSAWAVSGKGLLAVSELAIGALLARLLTPHDLGGYFLLLSIVWFGALAGSLGLAQATVRFVAEHLGRERRARLRPIMKAVAELAVLGAVAAGGLYWLFGDVLVTRLFQAPALTAVTGLAAVWMAAAALQRLVAESLRGFHDIRNATFYGGVLAALLMILGLILLVRTEERADLDAVLAIAAGAIWLSVLAGAGVVWRRLRAFEPSGRAGYREILRVAWPLLMINLTLFVLTQLDTWILAAFRPPQEVAIYAAASRLALAIMLASSVLYAVLPPVIAERHARSETALLERMLRAGATATAALAFPMFVVFVSFPEEILTLVYGEFYAQGAGVLVALSAGLFVNVLSGMRGYVLMLTGHERLELSISVAGGALNLGLCLLGVALWGMIGVALGAMIAMILQCLLEEAAVRRRLGIWTHLSFRSWADIRKMLAQAGVARG